jgi:hypothetical protein
MSMSERTAQRLEIAGHSGSVSSCPVNADTIRTASPRGAGSAPAPIRRATAPASRGGAFAPAHPPHPPRAKGTPPPLRQELAAGPLGDRGVWGGSAGWGVGMDAEEIERKRGDIRDLACAGEIDGWRRTARKRGYFDGESAALDERLTELTEGARRRRVAMK